MVPPPNSPWWVEIARMSSGDPVLVNLKSGADLYYVSGPENGWYYMSTTYGLEGYIKADSISYIRHLTPSETQPRTITTQLFRIRTVTVDTKEMRVTVNAQHVSYDLNGVLIDNVKIVRKPPAQALAWIEQAFMIDYRGTIATNMVSNVHTDYSAEISGKSGMFAILDPDQGVVPTFDAEYRRDNWDLFIMNKGVGDPQGQAATIQTQYFQLGNVQLLNRPQVPAATMAAAGWTDVGEGAATVFTNSYSAGTDGLEWYQNIIIHITPIRHDGTVLSPDALDSYVDTLLTQTTVEGILNYDNNNSKLVLWVQTGITNWDAAYEYGDLYDDLLHRLQAVYYMGETYEFPTEAELQEFNSAITVKGVDRGFRIRYGNNMRGVNWKVQGDKLVTRVVPVAKAADGSDLYLDPTRWVDSTRISDYPVIRMERLKVSGQVGKDDGTETATNWTEETLRAEMTKQAQARFGVDKADQLQHEITVDFEMLGETAEYPELKQLQQVVMYDTVIVIDERVGLGASVTVNEIEYDIIKEKITALKLTNVKPYNVKNVSGFNVLVNTITGDKLTDDAGDEIIVEAVDIATDEAEDYTNKKAAQTLNQSKEYTDETTQTAKSEAISAAAANVGSNHGYSTFEAYIKYWVDHH